MTKHYIKKIEKLFFVIVAMSSLSITPLFAHENHPPIYSSGSLSIPIIEDGSQPVLYRNAYLQYDQNINGWKLVNVETIPLDQNRIKEVKLMVTESQPVQVFLEIIGTFRLLCGDRDVVSILLNGGKKFEISVGFYSERSNECTDADKEQIYGIVYPLPVLDLNAGVYEYAVNQLHSGSFELKSLNRIPESLWEQFR
ncbi:MAG: hypothetical protein LZF61_09150 [Nitrosomonas sp.]|nr:MAG: hypothetical protein LZF61_09150 [Nitrosomonas sp.]